MQQIPIESLNLPLNLSFPISLTKNGTEVAVVMSSQEIEQRRKLSMKLAGIIADELAEAAGKNGMTPEIADKLLKDIS